MKNSICAIAFIFFTSLGFAQSKNTILVSTDMLKFLNRNRASYFIDQLGFSVTRRLKNNLDISIQYNRRNRSNSYIGISGIVFEQNNLIGTPGKIFARYNYQMIDAGVAIKLKDFKKYGFIKFGVAGSYTWGKDRYLDSIQMSNVPPYDNNIAFLHFERGEYLGIVPSIKYGINFWKDRFQLAAHIRARKYVNYPSMQIDMGFEFGVNF